MLASCSWSLSTVEGWQRPTLQAPAALPTARAGGLQMLFLLTAL